MIRTKKSKGFLLMAALVLSLACSGLASAASMMTMKKDGMEFVHLRQAAGMYGYSIDWNSKTKTVTLMYTGKMDDMMMNDEKMMNNDKMMNDDKMMSDDKTMSDDKMMNDDKMMDSGKKPMGETITLMIGSKKIMVNGKEVTLTTAPIASNGSTYVTEAFITAYMMPAMTMK